MAALVHPVAEHDDVGRAVVLDLEHGPLVRGVHAVERLGDHAVEPCALELDQPLPGALGVDGRPGDFDGVGEVAGELLQGRTPLGERPVEVGLGAEGEQVERDERGGGLLREQLHAAGGRVDAL